MKAVGKTGGLALLYFEMVSSLALVIGLLIVNLVQPGTGMNVDPATLDTKSLVAYTGPGKMQSTTEFLLNVIPCCERAPPRDDLAGAASPASVRQPAHRPRGQRPSAHRPR